MRNVILVDFDAPKSWGFRQMLEKTTGGNWDVIGLQSNRFHGGVRNLLRYAQYFWLPLRIYIKKSKYTAVLAWQQFYGLILAVYLRLFRAKKGPEIFVMTFIYKQKASWIGKQYFKFVRYAIKSPFIKTVFVYSRNEVKHYARLFDVPEMLFCAVQLGVEDEREQLYAYLRDEGYYVSAGRSNRDYAFLCSVWKGRKLRIICDTMEKENTENITFLNNCHNEDYLKQIAGCHAVVIPLQDENISSGQLVLLHAMMLGKPVIMTRNSALQEYVLNGSTGLIIDKTEDALDSAMSELDDEEKYCTMSAKAREHFEAHYTYEQLGKSVGEILCTH